MIRIGYEIVVDTDESDARLALLHRNLQKYGTITNTLAGGHPGAAFIDATAAVLRMQFGISRATLQIELGGGPQCRLDGAGQ